MSTAPFHCPLIVIYRGFVSKPSSRFPFLLIPNGDAFCSVALDTANFVGRSCRQMSYDIIDTPQVLPMQEAVLLPVGASRGCAGK